MIFLGRATGLSLFKPQRNLTECGFWSFILLDRIRFSSLSVRARIEQVGNYGKFVYGLQIVVETAGGWNEIRDDVLSGWRNMIVRACAAKGWRLAWIGLLSNHIHILIGCAVTTSPESVAMSLLNNLAFSQGMNPVFRFSYYVGTFGKYDRNAIRRIL